MNRNINVKKEDLPAIAFDNLQQKYTLKLLFGPMHGCELLLPAEDYFLIIHSRLAACDKEKEAVSLTTTQHAVHYALNTLYIPCDIPSPNIVLRLSQSPEHNDPMVFQLELQDTTHNFNTVIKENELFSHKHIHFAIKRHDDNWSDSIVNFNLLPVVPEKAVGDDSLNIFKPKKKKMILLGLFLLMLLSIWAGVIGYKQFKYRQERLSLTDALSGAPSPVQMVKSRDNNTIYILAHRLPEMEWATQAVYKLKDNNTFVPIWLSQQGQQVITHLSQLGYPVLQIDYSSPTHPVIAVYRQMTPAEVQNLKSASMKLIPFAADISTLLKSKVQLLAEARQGLDRLHIYYRQINTENGYALIVRDALSDSVLMALRDFITGYYQKWGSNVINFSINLDENWLQNKSYVDSSDGYLFLNPRHWYFPLKQHLER